MGVISVMLVYSRWCVDLNIAFCVHAKVLELRY